MQKGWHPTWHPSKQTATPAFAETSSPQVRLQREQGGRLMALESTRLSALELSGSNKGDVRIVVTMAMGDGRVCVSTCDI